MLVRAPRVVQGCGALALLFVWALSLVYFRRAQDQTRHPTLRHNTIHHGACRREGKHRRRARREHITEGAIVITQEDGAQEEAREEHWPRRPREGGRGALEGKQRQQAEVCLCPRCQVDLVIQCRRREEAQRGAPQIAR